MPFSSVDDVPARVKKFFKNIGASESMKRQWVHVFNSCKARGLSDGRCFRQANGVVSRRGNEFISNAIPEKVELVKADTAYGSVWQFPVTMTREGVQNGFFKDIEELRAAAFTANGLPIVFGHPHNEDGMLTAATRIYEFLGFTSNALIDETDLSLKATGNIFDIPDNELLLESIRKGENRDVSVGFFTDEFQADGEYRGAKYKGVEINIAFDHLAILPNGHGACSQSDRCGIGVNMTENKEQEPKESKSEPKVDLHGHMPGVVGSGPQSILTSCLREHVGAAYFSENPADITRHLQLALDCYKQRTEGQPSGPSKVQESQPSPSILQKKDIATKMLLEMGFDQEDLEGVDYDAIYYFLDCGTCSGAVDIADYEVTFDGEPKENVTYTFAPAWGSINKTDFPASAYMVVGDPEKKTTWKLPYKVGSKVHCGAIRAIRAVLAGARGGVNLTAEQRSKAKSLSDRHFAACQRIKERGDSKDPIIIKSEVSTPEPKNEEEKDLNTPLAINNTINMAEATTNPAPDAEKKPSPTEAELIATQGAKITELVTANEKLTQAVAAMTQAAEERKTADEKVKREAFEAEKRRVYEMNFKYRIYPDDVIAHADEKSIKLMEQALVTINSRKEDLRGVADLKSIGFSPVGVAPFTVGDLSKRTKAPQKVN